MKTKHFLTGVCVAAQLFLMTGCSSDEPAQPKVQFKTTAATLNQYLTRNSIPDADCSFSTMQVTAQEDPERELWVFADEDVMEIPAKGGVYNIKTYDARMLSLSIYEGVTLLSHNLEDYAYYMEDYGMYKDHYAIVNAYKSQLAERKGPDAVMDFQSLQNADTSKFGVFENADFTKGVDTFTYTLPENHTGKYRMYVLLHNDPWSIIDPVNPREGRENYLTYFIQMPD